MKSFAKTCSFVFVLLYTSPQVYAADPLTLTEIKGFSGGMSKEQVEAVLDQRGIHYVRSGDKPTILGWIMYALGECPKKIGLAYVRKSTTLG